uniref:DUF676 domain-containing protein n=1 Tax=Fibrocapsa japonica TaxID=94617 RepID=A0A7S2V233_9STRA
MNEWLEAFEKTANPEQHTLPDSAQPPALPKAQSILKWKYNDSSSISVAEEKQSVIDMVANSESVESILQKAVGMEVTAEKVVQAIGGDIWRLSEYCSALWSKYVGMLSRSRRKLMPLLYAKWIMESMQRWEKHIFVKKQSADLNLMMNPFSAQIPPKEVLAQLRQRAIGTPTKTHWSALTDLTALKTTPRDLCMIAEVFSNAVWLPDTVEDVTKTGGEESWKVFFRHLFDKVPSDPLPPHSIFRGAGGQGGGEGGGTCTCAGHTVDCDPCGRGALDPPPRRVKPEQMNEALIWRYATKKVVPACESNPLRCSAVARLQDYHGAGAPEMRAYAGDSAKPGGGGGGKKRSKAAADVHVIVLQHGLQGNRMDLVYFQLYLQALFPSALIYAATTNEGVKMEPIAACGARLADEVSGFILEKAPQMAGPEGRGKLSFVGHSVGGLIVRAALARGGPLDQFSHCLHFFLTLSTPHLGNMFPVSSLVDSGMRTYNSLQTTPENMIAELLLEDSSGSFQETSLFKLSTGNVLSKFKSLVLVTIAQDLYVPKHSALIQFCEQIELDTREGILYARMVDNLLRNVEPDRVTRLNLKHEFNSWSLDSMIGRAAHLALVEMPVLARFILFAVYDKLK